ncbi:MAG: hypothetical protein HAW67_01465 [Endozoicomonadaceae bacterium]|nr:hypothetical protein [Endozoicomonadaceae bacterium]
MAEVECGEATTFFYQGDEVCHTRCDIYFSGGHFTTNLDPLVSTSLFGRYWISYWKTTGYSNINQRVFAKIIHDKMEKHSRVMRNKGNQQYKCDLIATESNDKSEQWIKMLSLHMLTERIAKHQGLTIKPLDKWPELSVFGYDAGVLIEQAAKLSDNMINGFITGAKEDVDAIVSEHDIEHLSDFCFDVKTGCLHTAIFKYDHKSNSSENSLLVGLPRKNISN